MKDHSSVAVAGLSCRFPGNGGTLETFWESICAGESAWSEIPHNRFNKHAFWSSNKRRSTSAAIGGHFLQQDISRFDAGFFGLPKHDVDAMDPQQRIIMEVAYEALERAGMPLEQIAGTRTGVFIGHLTSDYRDMICRDPDNAPVYTFTGTGTASVANRISWLWDLKGPSFTVNTACSSGLLALHLACQSLLTGESDMAIVGASSLLLSSEMFMFLSNQGFLAPDGKCKSFDASADGYGRGEGFGCLILKRTRDAILDGDPIRALIRGTGSNQDGHTVGLTMPSLEAQRGLIEEVYYKAGLNPGNTAYVEAHGTGTKLGDSHEMSALAATIAAARDPESKLLVGSVKSNIGHLEAAAGIAGLIKAVLMLETGLIPPSIHFKTGNPAIDFEQCNVEVPQKLSPWPAITGPRRVSVNSFGYGGSNVHAVLEAYEGVNFLRNPTRTARPNRVEHEISKNGVDRVDTNGTEINGDKPNGHTTSSSNVSTNDNEVKSHDMSNYGIIPSTETGTPRMFLLSAQDKDGLKRQMKPLADYVQGKTSNLLKNKRGHSDETERFMALLAYTLSERRSHLQWKAHIIASSPEELIASLITREHATTTPMTRSSRSPRVGFIFTGQGAQWPRMGAELMSYRVFRDSIEAADLYLRQECDCSWSVVEELLKPKEASLVNQSAYSHPLCSILQIALVDLVKSWNITPVAVTGHSGGEIGASYAAGALTRESAWTIAYYRGYVAALMKIKAPKLRGSMMAVGLSHTEVSAWFPRVAGGLLVVACINSPISTTVAGDTPAIDQLLELLQAGGVFARKLVVDTAYHSPHMAVIAEDYRCLTFNIRPNAQLVDGCAMYSTVTGGAVQADQVGPDHWIASLTSPVRFCEAVSKMVQPSTREKKKEERAVDIIVEIGPHSTLQGPSKQSLKALGIDIPHYSVVNRNQNAIETALSVAGALYNRGYPVRLPEASEHIQLSSVAPLVDVPTYPWNHTQRFWHDTRLEHEFLSRSAPIPGILGAPMPPVVAGERVWRGFLRLSESPWIADHKIQGEVLYPGAGFITMAIEAALQTDNPAQEIASFKLKDIQLTSAAIVHEGTDLEYTIQLRPHLVSTRDSASTWTRFAISTSPDGKSLVQNCCGLIIIEYAPSHGSEASHERNLADESLRSRYAEVSDTCEIELDMAGFYTLMQSRGLDYGPVFANVVQARHGNGHSIGTVRIPNVSVPYTDRPHVIHPGTLDAVFHLAFTAFDEFRDGRKAAMVPKLIDEVTISTNLPSDAGSKLTGFSSAAKHGLNNLSSDIVMFDEGKVPMIKISGFVCAELAGISSAASKAMIASKLTWKPAIDFLSMDEITSMYPGNTAEATLKGFCDLMHHSYPGLSVLELAPTVERTGNPAQTQVSSNFQLDGLGGLTKTWNVTVVCPGDTTRETDDIPTQLKTIDLSHDLSNQLPLSLYDLVLLTDPTLTSADAIANVCAAIKPGGTLCFSGTKNSLITFRHILDASKLDVGIWDVRGSADDTVFVVARKGPLSDTNPTDNVTEREVILLQAREPTESASKLTSKLAETMNQHHLKARAFRLGDDLSLLEGKSCISLLEYQQSLLYDINNEDFEAVKKIILTTRDVLWVTALDNPSSAMIDGLVRVVRNESPGLEFRLLHADDPSCLSLPKSRLADLILQIFLYTGKDNEFKIKSDRVYINRVDEDAELSDEMSRLLPDGKKSVVNISVGDISRPTKLCVRSPGILSTLCLEPDDAAETELECNYIEIDTKATAINFREIMVAMGQMADTALGLDAAGIVRQVGSSVTSFKVGDRVMMYGYGAHRTRHRSRADYCALIPEGMTFQQAASVPVVHATAWNALVRVAKVQPGQSILIHAAAGGVGQVALQIAQHYKMNVFVTVSTDAKRNLMRVRYGLPDDHIFNSRDVSFAKGIKRMTSGRGVDVVLNSLAGEALRQTWHCIAPFGHFVEIGIKDILNNTGLDMKPFIQDATFTFFNLRHIDESRPELMASILEGAFDFLRRSITRPLDTLHDYPISDMESAFRLMQSGKHLGKITLSWNDEHVVPVIQGPSTPPKLSPTHAYLLVGGLGGIGRSLALKLVSLGARKLCFLSRTGSQSSRAQDLVRKLQQKNVQVQVCKCDVSDEREVLQVVDRCTRELGAIKGVFQCAMVLRDGLFAQTTHQRWVESTRPKVQGSWNIHKHLPSDMDFFVILSSFTGVFGSRGQSNYAAAGAYEDALAYYRRARGLHATTIDLGLMRDIGVLAETGITDAFRHWEKPYGIGEAEFLGLIERVIYHDTIGDRSPQVITGLATGSSAISAGIEKPYYLDDARFSIMERIGMDGKHSSTGSHDAVPTSTLISQAKTLEEASDGVLSALVNQVAKILQIEPAEIDTNKFLHSFGIDSLVAVEIVNWLVRETKAAVTVLDVLAGVPMTTLCSRIAAKSPVLPKELGSL
ncbi:putative polyketide synthase [Xylariaceae sp. FL1272]|nr:putative polyketide synthase [Xylariaceae sp. FL1272]